MTTIRKIAAWLDRWHWAWLILATPFLLFPTPSRSFALLIVPALWLIALVARRAPLPRTPFNLIVLLMFLMVLVSEWATYDLAFSLPKIAGMVLGVGIYFSITRIGGTPRGWWLACGVLLLSGVGIAGLGLLGTNFGNKIGFLAPIIARLSPRVLGLPGAETGFSPNELAGALVWVLPLFITLMLVVFRSRWRWARGVGIALLIGAMLIASVLVLAQSRGSYLGLISMIALFILSIVPRRFRAVVLIVAGIGLVIVIGVIVFQPNLLVGLIGGTSASETTDALAVIESANGRTEVWSRAIYGIQDFPFTGMGMNTFRKVVNVLYPFFLISPDADIAHAHNEFLQAALDLGIPGLIAFIALYAIAFWLLFQLWRGASASTDSGWVRAITLGLAGGLIAHLVYGMTDAVTLGAKPGFIFWMMLGLIAALFKLVKDGRGVMERGR